MAAARGRSASRFVGHVHLVDACAEAGCPVCRCVAESSRRYLAAVVYEQVNDPETRRHLRASWGLCNWHAWMLEDTPGARFGAAIIAVDLLGRMIGRVRRLGDRPGGRTRRGWRGATRSLARLARLAGRRPGPGLVTLYARRLTCPACDDAARAEDAYLDIVLESLADAEFREAYERSHGLCVPHVMVALARGAGRPETGTLLAVTATKWTDLRDEVARFVGKHDYRNTEPVTDEEAVAVQHAVAVLAGGRALFGNDLHASRPRTPAAPARPATKAGGVIAALRSENERLREEIAALKASAGRDSPSSG